MQYEPWKTEFAKFTDASIEEMKRHSDDTHLEREWMTYIYEEDYGIMISNGTMPMLYRDESGEQKIFDTQAAAEKFQKENNIPGQITTVYHLGEVSYGEESRIEGNPATKEMQDAALKQVNPKNRKIPEFYRKVFTWNDSLVDGDRFIKINFPNTIRVLDVPEFIEKKIQSA